MAGECVFTEFNVAARCIVEPANLSKLIGALALGLLIDHRLNFLFDGIGEFFAITVKEFNAIVIKRIVRSTDHDTR